MKFKKRLRCIKNGLIYNPVMHNRYYSVHAMRSLSYVVSYRKSGRTWVMNVLGHYIGKKTGQLDEALPFFNNPERHYPELMQLGRRIVFVHNFFIPEINPACSTHKYALSPFTYAPSAFLIRDPRDVVISYYYHLRDRAMNKGRIGKKADLDPDAPIDEFVYNEKLGLKPIINYYNELIYFFRHYTNNARFFKYEDLRGQDGQSYDISVWRDMFDHIFQEKTNTTDLEWALETNTFDRLKKRHNAYKSQIQARHPDALGRVRAGKKGGYSGELKHETIAFCDDYIRQHLDDYYTFYKT